MLCDQNKNARKIALDCRIAYTYPLATIQPGTQRGNVNRDSVSLIVLGRFRPLYMDSKGIFLYKTLFYEFRSCCCLLSENSTWSFFVCLFFVVVVVLKTTLFNIPPNKGH